MPAPTISQSAESVHHACDRFCVGGCAGPRDRKGDKTAVVTTLQRRHQRQNIDEGATRPTTVSQARAPADVYGSMRLFALVFAAGVLALPATASAATCPVSPKSNGTGYKPALDVKSLPPVGTGPDILHSALPTSPQLENTGFWRAPPILISGTTAYRDGEFLYQDFLYDDRALTYPDDPKRLARNAADFVEVRLKPLKSATAIRITLNSMLDPNAAAVTIGFGSNARALPIPHNAGAKMPAKVFVTAHGCSGDVVRAADGAALARPLVTTDLKRRQFQIEVPYRDFDPRGRTVRVGAAVDCGTRRRGSTFARTPVGQRTSTLPSARPDRGCRTRGWMRARTPRLPLATSARCTRW